MHDLKIETLLGYYVYLCMCVRGAALKMSQNVGKGQKGGGAAEEIKKSTIQNFDDFNMIFRFSVFS